IEKQIWSAADGRVEILRGQIQFRGPHTAAEVAERLHLEPSQVCAALESLEGSGLVMRGTFRSANNREQTCSRKTVSAVTLGDAPGPGLVPANAEDVEWCERRLLARIHRQT